MRDDEESELQFPLFLLERGDESLATISDFDKVYLLIFTSLELALQFIYSKARELGLHVDLTVVQMGREELIGILKSQTGGSQWIAIDYPFKDNPVTAKYFLSNYLVD